jgi:hypothetical protein
MRAADLPTVSRSRDPFPTCHGLTSNPWHVKGCHAKHSPGPAAPSASCVRCRRAWPAGSEQFYACMSDEKEEDNSTQQAAGGGGLPPWKIVAFCPILAG